MTLDEAVQSVLDRHGYKRRPLSKLVAMWKSLVDQCLEGYRWTIYEFDDEMSVREYIDSILDDPVVASFPEFEGFAQQIQVVDEIYRSVLQPGVRRPSPEDTWWSTGVLKYAGDEYRSDMLSSYSIAVDPYPDELDEES